MSEWRHYEPTKAGLACVIAHHRFLRQRAVVGAVTTGKQRVFHSFYVSVELPDGSTATGEDRHSVIAALDAVAVVVRDRGFRLLSAGLDKRFYETGLTHNTGCGYIEGFDQRFDIFDVSPYPRSDRDGDSYLRA